MEKIAIFGKGGSGKSTFAANLAAACARRGRRVLLVGCDPKHDTTVLLTDGRPIITVVERDAAGDAGREAPERLVVRGRLGVDCIEAGGPEPGTGCAGRGISRMIEVFEETRLLERRRYDVVLFDVLGDVVCGDFAAPLRQGLADKVCILVSEELLALYAANNIARAVRTHASNGVALAGLVANLRDPAADRAEIARFARLLGTRVLTFAGREPLVRAAERRRRTVVELFPRSAFARRVAALADELLRFRPREAAVPRPLSDERFHRLFRVGFDERALSADEAAPEPPPSEPAVPTPSEPAVPPPAAPTAPATGAAGRAVALRLRRDLASRSWRIALPDGSRRSNAEQWGDPDRWRRFFCDFETCRNARTRLETDTRAVEIWHQDLECSFATASFFGGHPSFFDFPWYRPRPRATPRRSPEAGPRDGRPERPASLVTNLRQLDVVHGGAARLEAALRAAARACPDAGAIQVTGTCVPTVIGDDARAVTRRLGRRLGIPVYYANPAGNEYGDAARAFVERARRAAARRRPRPRSINLVGFPEGPALDELVALLEAAGVVVRARVFPAFDLRQAGEYLAATAQILYPNADYDEAYAEAFEPLPIRTLRPPAPFGWGGTRRWIEAVATACGADPRRAGDAVRRAQAPLRRVWREGRAAAAGYRVAFVVDLQEADRLRDPPRMWGVPVVPLLEELGFGIDVLCFDDRGRAPSSFLRFRTPAELERLLREGSFAAVYSEFTFDDRLVRAGKARFALSAFEPGLAGAVRTLERLVEICRWPFPRRYAAWAAPANG